MNKIKCLVGLGLAAFLVVGSAFAGTTTVWNVGNTATATGSGIGTAQVTSDGTSATLTIDIIKAGVTNVISSTGLAITPGGLTVAGNQTNSGTLKIVGTSTLGGIVSANNITIATNLAYSASSGNVTHNGNLTVNTNLAYSASSGNVTHNGNLIVNTNFTVLGTVTVPALSIANAAIAGKAELCTLVSASIATNANGGTNVVTFTAKDINGVALPYPTAFRFWISDDGQGTPAAVAGDVAISGGVELQEVLNKADYWVMSTNLAGTCIATITDTPGGTNYIHVMAPAGRISKIPSAFNIP